MMPIRCVGPDLAVDGTGRCHRECGGESGATCDEGQTCVDTPDDGCDPARGGVDCTGVCYSCEDAVQCSTGYHWDTGSCDCVANTECGGKTGAACAPGKTCYDVPRDGCHQDEGGVDCAGFCGADCRITGCEAGSSCGRCWSVYACIPDGAVC